MEASELAVWSAMLGGLLTLAALAIGDALFSQSIASVRNLLFVVITGTSCVVLTGLPEVIFPGMSDGLSLLLKTTSGPLAGSIALHYLGIWLGGMEEDVIVHRVTSWGARAAFFGAMVLALLATVASSQDFRLLLQAASIVTMMAVLLASIASIRAAMLGDPLARWMVLACACLIGMVSGLSLKVLHVAGFGVATWIVTAACTVAYFSIVTVLVIMRNRKNRQLASLAGLQFGADPVTGLPTGSVLLSKVELAFRRTARLHGKCTVVCLHLRNLYELSESAGHAVEPQILKTVARRIRRVAGFRCLVGLYHPRCFVVVISAYKRHKYVPMTVTRLQTLVAESLPLVGFDGSPHAFTPDLGLGVARVDPASADVLAAITSAELQAMASPGEDASPTEDEVDTIW
jgi:GGDEF domain-containing protein